jgi:hypothetical protein
MRKLSSSDEKSEEDESGSEGESEEVLLVTKIA